MKKRIIIESGVQVASFVTEFIIYVSRCKIEKELFAFLI